MSQVINTVAVPAGSALPTLPADLLALLNVEADKASASISGMALNVLRPRRSLELIINGVKEEIPYGQLAMVMITSAEFNHAVWYHSDYNPGNADTPDLIWVMRRENEFPAALPKQYHTKIGVGKNAHWGFQIRRRTVWARILPDGMDLANPFILDIPSSLLYGRSDKQGCFTWRDIIAFCKQESMRGVAVYPGMFPCTIVPHTMPTLGLFYFKPAVDPNGYIKYLSVDMIRKVLEAAQEEDIKSLAQVREKLEWGDAVVQPAVTPASQPAPAPQPKPQPAPQAQSKPQPASAPQAPAATTAATNEAAPTPQTGTAGLIAQAGAVMDAIANQPAQPQAPQETAAVQQEGMQAMFASLGF